MIWVGLVIAFIAGVYAAYKYFSEGCDEVDDMIEGYEDFDKDQYYW